MWYISDNLFFPMEEVKHNKEKDQKMNYAKKIDADGQEEFMIPDDDTAEEVRKLRRVVTFQTFIVSVLMIIQLYVFWPVH